MISRHKKLGLLSRVIDGEVVIFDRAAGKVHQLNASASCIWECCAGSLSVADISEHLVARFDVSPERARNDVMAALAQFERLGLMVMGVFAPDERNLNPEVTPR